MKPIDSKSKPRQALIVTACFASLGLLGWVDYITGYELGFFIFYSVPVGLAAWHTGRWPAIGVSLAASLTWWLADYYSGHHYSSWFLFYWNNGIHFLSFAVNAVTIAAIKSDLDRRHALVAELGVARSTLRAVAALLAVCPGCGKPNDRAEKAGNAGSAFSGPCHPDLAAALCATCRTMTATSPGSRPFLKSCK